MGNNELMMRTPSSHGASALFLLPRTEHNHNEQPNEQPFVRAERTPCLHEVHFGAGMSNEMTKEKREARREGERNLEQLLHSWCENQTG